MRNKFFLVFVVALCSIFASCNKEGALIEDLNETFYIRSGGADMPVFMRGNGLSKTIVILLHGGPGDGSLGYSEKIYAQQLHEKYAFAYWDQRQQGNAHGHLSPEDVSLEIIVEDLHLLVQSLKARYGEENRIFLMGHSWGGTVGTAYLQTENYQDDIAGFIEISGGYDFPMINKEAIKMMQEFGGKELAKGNNIEIWTEILDFAGGLNPENISADESLDLNAYAGMISRDELLEDQYKIASTRGFEEGSSPGNSTTSSTMNAIAIFTQLNLIDDLLATSLTEDLDKITVPTLLIWGKYDFKVPPRLGEIALENLGSTDKTLLIYEHAGHSSMNSDPDRFVDDVINFID